MATIGSLIVDLRANTASFKAEMDNARKGLKDTGTTAGATERQLAQLAGKGFGSVVEGAEGAGRAIEKFIEKGLKGGGAMATLAKGGILLGAGLLAYSLGNKIAEWKELGMSVDAYVEKMKKAADEEREFNQALRSAASLRAGMAKAGLQAETEFNVARKQGQDDERGALRESLEGRLAALDLEHRDRLRSINDIKVTEDQKAALIQGSEDQRRKQRNAAYAKDAVDRKKIDDTETQKLVEKWQQETAALIEQFKARLAARQQFEAQLGTGATALGVEGSSTVGLKRLADARENMRKALRDLAFDERAGKITPRDAFEERMKIQDAFIRQLEQLKTDFAGVAVVIDAVNTALVSVQTGTFQVEIENARIWVDKFVATEGELISRNAAIQAQFENLPSATDKASKAYKDLEAAAADLAWALFSVNQQLETNLRLAREGAG